MKVKFYTLGCKVNQYETEALREEFMSLGCRLTEANADLCVINTCAVTSRADAKSREMVSRAKRENPRARIAVCGCTVDAKSTDNAHLAADYIIPQSQKQFVADIVLNRPIEKKDIWALKLSSFSNHRAFIKIQDGCDKRCSFCKIPHIRGRSISRGAASVLTEVKRVSLSNREIVLCGINIGLYGKDLTPPRRFADLVRDILRIDSLGRLRLSSLEPATIDSDLFNLFDNSKLCPHLHFPFQSGDDKVLLEMNKQETVLFYENVIRRLKEINPLFAVSCDIMVGFPAEDGQSFMRTVNFLKKIKPMRMHIFTFSPREYTKFSAMKIKNYRIVKKRHDYLKKIAGQFSLEYARSFLGRVLYAIAEEEKDGYIQGYCENYLKVCIKDKVKLGELYPVKITAVSSGKILASRA